MKMEGQILAENRNPEWVRPGEMIQELRVLADLMEGQSSASSTCSCWEAETLL